MEQSPHVAKFKFAHLLQVIFVIIIIFILIIGKFLWNVVLCRLLTIAKPADSIWQILGLSILFNLIYA